MRFVSLSRTSHEFASLWGMVRGLGLDLGLDSWIISFVATVVEMVAAIHLRIDYFEMLRQN